MILIPGKISVLFARKAADTGNQENVLSLKR